MHKFAYFFLYLPTIPKIFKPVTQNTLIFLYGRTQSLITLALISEYIVPSWGIEEHELVSIHRYTNEGQKLNSMSCKSNMKRFVSAPYLLSNGAISCIY